MDVDPLVEEMCRIVHGVHFGEANPGGTGTSHTPCKHCGRMVWIPNREQPAVYHSIHPQRQCLVFVRVRIDKDVWSWQDMGEYTPGTIPSSIFAYAATYWNPHTIYQGKTT